MDIRILDSKKEVVEGQHFLFDNQSQNFSYNVKIEGQLWISQEALKWAYFDFFGLQCEPCKIYI